MAGMMEGSAVFVKEGETEEREHEIFCDDVWDGNVEQAAAHFRKQFPGAKNLRVRKAVRHAAPAAAPKVISPK